MVIHFGFFCYVNQNIMDVNLVFVLYIFKFLKIYFGPPVLTPLSNISFIISVDFSKLILSNADRIFATISSATAALFLFILANAYFKSDFNIPFPSMILYNVLFFSLSSIS